ncbi:unnamed protein product [Lactuca virosa]|uniref:Uncharacterized protein n=1 Tax=Lactuca virosa TaxID=75947 RepID=A0AAU9PUY7_9ASTR|nr:unnamed protein product [Lactuca virosa]
MCFPLFWILSISCLAACSPPPQLPPTTATSIIHYHHLYVPLLKSCSAKPRQIWRIDFDWAVEREDPNKKQKKGDSTASSSKDTTSSSPWPWQNMVENLKLAHQELSAIIDLINTVEIIDAVTVAGMTRPKQLPNELLSDLAVSTATKLQCFRQSAKALEKQVAKEARFYGALISRIGKLRDIERLLLLLEMKVSTLICLTIHYMIQQLYFTLLQCQPVRVEHDNAGMLALNLPSKACHVLQFGFVGDDIPKRSNGRTPNLSNSEFSEETKKEDETDDDDDDDGVKKRHSDLREVHRAVFNEQVFNLINQEALIQVFNLINQDEGRLLSLLPL